MKSNEIIEKVKSAKSVEGLITLAKENGIEMTEETAKTYFEQLQKSGELSDDELENTSGGGCHTSSGDLLVGIGNECDNWICAYCERPFDGDHHHNCPDKGYIECECQHCKYSTGSVDLAWLGQLCFEGCSHPDKVK